MRASLLQGLGFLALQAIAVDPLVKLNYASYRGTPLKNGVTQWLGLHYAANPTKGLRFAEPADIDIKNKEYQADTRRPSCIGVENESKDSGHSEDCLYLNVYAPSDAKPDAKLAVFFYIQGGGFSNQGQAPNGTSLVTRSDKRMIVVTIAYRVAAYGFLNGEPSAKKGEGKNAWSNNNGLKDQAKALRWVKDHIESFGGDKNHIVIGGSSAGGGCVIHHLINPETQNLVAGAITSSAAWPAIYDRKDGQYQFEEIAKAVKCDSDSDKLACMRRKDTKEFQTAIHDLVLPFPGGRGKPLFMYSPSVDGGLIKENPWTYFDKPTINKPLLIGNDGFDGLGFTPKSISTQKAADEFVQNQYPGLMDKDVKKIHDLARYKGFIKENKHREYAARLYGDIRYACPNLFVASARENEKQPIWGYRWDVGTATHTSETDAIWYGTAENAAGSKPPKTDAHHDAARKQVHAYWVSFITELDPNPKKEPDAPTWDKAYKGAGLIGDAAIQRLSFTDHGGPPTTMEAVGQEMAEACAFLKGLGAQMKQ
ncbi:Alpha/Beta hydrolase protein [Phyllosticta citrichinensis]|uniref:Carboxylic ester hydrolase n=1 Tax=Phyllosticta citrichinensis TaxID=1130410 RepID=A0ABR1XIX7_9PEZI